MNYSSLKIPGIHLFVLMMLILPSCHWHRNRLEVDISGIRIPETKIHRYDRDLFKVPVSDLSNGLKKLEPEYTCFLGSDLDNPVKLEKMRDYLQNPRNIDFQQATERKFPDLSDLEKKLNDGFRHFKYYFPDARLPKVYSYISGGEYNTPVEISDSILIIALDIYLGKDFRIYQSDGVPNYKIARMTPDFIVPDCMSALILDRFPADPSVLTLLGQMVEAGKRLYLLDAMLPGQAVELKTGYTPEQIDWIRRNEEHVWGSIIENRMLYSSKGDVLRVFLADGPFTTEFSKDSPPRLGEWIGWQIVTSFMEKHPEVTLPELMQEKDAQRILMLSGYKPQR